jgi:5-deoxy-glucuronate isomerase
MNVKRGCNEYLNIDTNNGENSWMDVALMVMEQGDIYSFEECEKELACLLLSGTAVLDYPENTAVLIERLNPFDYNPYCLHVSAGDFCVIKALSHCELYIKKTINDKKFQATLYTPDKTDTWRRGAEGECGGCIKRDVRTCFDYENAPYSNMVLGEVVNLPGKWSSYPPHDHPQPEVYFFHFEKAQGFGAGWVDGTVEELHHNGLAVITKGTHPMVMAPGYACCYVWGIRHLPGNPWKKTRIDDPLHTWLNDPDAVFWNGGENK